MGELGLVHRHELSGALHGLMRVRCFTQDDAHIFMTKEQIKDEIKGVVRLIDKVYSTFGFEYHIELSTQPEDSMGAKEDWDIATNALRDAITELGYSFEVNEETARFMVLSLISILLTVLAEHGSAVPFSLTFKCRSGSNWSIPEPMGPNTALS